MTGAWADALRPLLPLFIVGLIVAMAFRRSKPAKLEQLSDEVEGTPYRIFTSEFDVELSPATEPEKLAVLIPEYGVRALADEYQASTVVRRSEAIYDDAAAGMHRIETQVLIRQGSRLANSAVTLLIDQSGSMRGEPIAQTVAVVRHLSEMLLSTGASVEVLGFSTAGWRGGLAYQKWMASGRPDRPGRLCSLLHLKYKTREDRSLTPDAWRAILDPNLLHENIDGEALEWAAGRLLKNPNVAKILIVISDGAPVDDATLMFNGPSYLERHLKTAVATIVEDGVVSLGAIGIGHDVSRYYPVSEVIDDPAHIPSAVVRLFENLLDASYIEVTV